MNRDYGKSKASASGPRSYGKVTRMADGMEVEEAQMKQAGLDASNKELESGDQSFMGRLKQTFGRLSEGNIDDPKSEAYRKYGAGRGRQDAAYGDAGQASRRLDVEPKAAEPAKPSAPAAGGDDDYESRIAARAASTYKQEDSAPAPVKRAAAKPAVSAPKVTGTSDGKPRSVVDGGGADSDEPKAAPAKSAASSASYSNEGRGREVTRASIDKKISDEFDNTPLSRAIKSVTKNFRSEGPSMNDMVGVRKGNQSNRYHGLTGKRLTASDDPRVIKK